MKFDKPTHAEERRRRLHELEAQRLAVREVMHAIHLKVHPAYGGSPDAPLEEWEIELLVADFGADWKEQLRSA